MIFRIKKRYLDIFNKDKHYQWVQDLDRWATSPDKLLSVDVTNFKDGELKEIEDIFDKHKSESNARNNLRLVKNYNAFAADYSGSKVVKKVETFPAALRAFYRDKHHKWIFIQRADGELLPYFIISVDYEPPRRDRDGNYHKAYSKINLLAYRSGKKISATKYFYQEDLGYPIGKVLQNQDLFIETPDAVERYINELKKFNELQPQTGLQMHAVGAGSFRNAGYYSSERSVSMVRDGRPTKVVIDDISDNESTRADSIRTSARFWGENTPITDYMKPSMNSKISEALFEEPEEDFDEDEEVVVDDTVVLPHHPYLDAFDLDKHEYVNLHINNIVPYPWDKTVFDKLILPESQKTLIHMLVQSTNDSVEDIISGKMGGVIVLTTGLPGLGKTLTAEVFSETIEKPLYVVQCSQLGLDVDSVESNLKDVLSRAEKWGAILLIDEADVYIRERGDDIVQNAIVGVFLRVLEYYRGILFMTSNRGDIIDDAIMSRATAWVQYQLPSENQLIEIYEVLSKQYGADLKKADIKFIISKIGITSGRTVRNLLKLARLLSKKKGTKITKELVLEVSNYQQLESKKIKTMEKSA